MNGQMMLGLDGTTLIDRLTNDVHDTAETFATDGHGDGGTGVGHLLTAHQTFRAVHGNGADRVFTV